MQRILRLQKLQVVGNTAEAFESTVSCGCTSGCASDISIACTGQTQA